MRRLFWLLFVGTRGGSTRAEIVRFLKEKPSNANQLAEALNLNYKTIRHHLKVLLDNELIVAEGEGYSIMYFLSPLMEQNYVLFEEIRSKIWKK
ncbi:MAG: winged helix-turn-helix domain-containing protein [Euryarchaeota archaeon]|nr:winged helix-turn-helix domain-containing protein [Euryarchaeota archaeon]